MTAALTLGGFDASKFRPANNASFEMSIDVSRDLVVGLHGIEVHTNATTRKLLLTGIPIFIDSTIPEIWLPRESCDLFEEAFGLQYNPVFNRYLVNETLHSHLQSLNLSVSFQLGIELNGSSTVNITLPYGGLDLELSDPYTKLLNVTGTQRYFPIRRADNDSQYTLGRTFLQEA